jgi:D-serine deaminase-like pyridoxal phosphate-dependent protein
MTTTKAGCPTRGAAHNEYFSAINALLKEQGIGHPVMVLDLDILDQNIRILKQKMPPPKSFRVVVKSLPSVELLRHVFDMAGTARAMVFHRPFLNRIAREFPNVDVLLGKPLPVRAARIFYRELGEDARFDPATHLQWLIDTQDRLLQYQHLAKDLGTWMRINIELDVGLHRGGAIVDRWPVFSQGSP